ncbi:MAG: dimethylsulfoniopropionate demethylase [Pseudomonadales bacterium]
MFQNKKIVASRRVRPTHFSERVEAAGVQTYTCYNHMLLPTEFESVEADYWHLCEHVQVWDVSVERQVQLLGPDAARLAQLMTPRDLSKAQPLQGKYAPMCDSQGRILNDPVVIKLTDGKWWISLADSDIKLWAKGLAEGFGLDVQVSEPDVSPLGVQGPKAEILMQRVFGNEVSDIRFFWGKMLPFKGHEMYVARSGWSKQGGFEIYVDNAELAVPLWDALFEAGADLEVRAGCPNQIERMESGLLSYGSDMDEYDTVFECGLDSFLNLEADIESLSLPALRELKTQQSRKLFGVLFPQKMPFTMSYEMLEQGAPYEMRSHAWSPRYNKHMTHIMLPLSFARENEYLLVDGVRGKITGIPFTKEQLESHE